MATFTKESTRGKTLYLLRMDKPLGPATVYLDATKSLMDAEKTDTKNGFDQEGPVFGQELRKATEYADYVNTHATIDNLHRFNHDQYVFFAETNTLIQQQKAQSNVRTDISV